MISGYSKGLKLPKFNIFLNSQIRPLSNYFEFNPKYVYCLKIVG